MTAPAISRQATLPSVPAPTDACRRCTHGLPSSGRVCHCPAVTNGRGPVPVELARGRGGSCGLDGWHHSYQRPPR